MKIGIFCGNSSEVWSPKSVETGIGGSEEAVINIGKELAKRGHDVKVWNNCGDAAGQYDGVDYIDFLDYEDDELDIFIGWRNKSPFKFAKNYKKSYMWLHDTVPAKEVMDAMTLGAERIMVLSRYHRRLYPQLKNNEVFLTRNGIDPKHFKQDVKRVPGRIFWGSSYDRGLKEVLENWPKIKLENPDATLHIAYGWKTWENIAKSKGSIEAFKTIKKNMEQAMDQEGVTHLGRISHEDVAKEMLEADLWGYPTWWPEISCITAMKAQAAGAIPVVIPTAALAETVQYGYKTDRGYYNDINGSILQPEEGIEQWVDAVNNYLSKSEKEKASLREEMMSWSQSYYSWESLAEQWEREFSNAL